MIDQLTHYEALGVSQSATQSEIRSAYKALVLKFHPVNPLHSVPLKLIFYDRTRTRIKNLLRRSSTESTRPIKS